MPLILRRLGIDRVVERERTVEDPAGDLAAVRHLAERRRLDGRGDLGGDGLDRRQDRDPRGAKADLRVKVDRVLDDVALGIEIGSDIDRRIGDEQRVRMGRHVHDEHMADPPRGAQAGRGGRNRPHQFVGVQAALHQQFALGLVNELNRLAPPRHRCAARRRSRSQLMSMPIAVRGRRDLARRADQNGHDDPGGGGFDCAAQRCLIAGMHDDRGRGRNVLRPRDQALVFAFGACAMGPSATAGLMPPSSSIRMAGPAAMVTALRRPALHVRSRRRYRDDVFAARLIARSKQLLDPRQPRLRFALERPSRGQYAL